MGFGKTAERIKQLGDTVEQLYDRLREIHERVTGVEERLTAIDERVRTLERLEAEERALVEAIADDHGLDVDAIVAAAEDERAGDDTDDGAVDREAPRSTADGGDASSSTQA